MNDTVYYLIEIRNRLLRVLAVFVALAVVAACYADKIYHYLALPIINHLAAGQSLIAISVPAPFLVPFKAALMATLFVTAPYLFYQLWAFVAPALYKTERRIVWMLLATSTLLFYLGVVFSYVVVLPLIFKFFIAIAPEGIKVTPDIGQYFSFVLKMFFAFGFAFELPVAVVLVCWTGITTPAKLAQKRPYMIVFAFVMGMLLTPPDIISQVLLALPLWLLFELGLMLARTLLRQRIRDVSRTTTH